MEHFKEDLKSVRTGRAHPSMLDGVVVQAYGTSMPLIQVANITTPEAQQLQITPFDPANIQAITTAIRDNQALGLNPMDDGRVVRVPIPPLTEDRRREFVKLVSTKLEDAMIALRNARHDALREAEAAEKDKAITQDDTHSIKKELDDLMTAHKNEAESLSKAKEKEIMTV
jgi:ribosome recycling factor